MKIQFQADADLNREIVDGLRLREPAIDIWMAREGGVIGKPDPEVLRLAAESGRVLISHDQNTMPRHFTEFLRERSSPGLIIVPQDVRVRLAMEELLMIWVASEAEEWVNVFDFVPI